MMLLKAMYGKMLKKTRLMLRQTRNIHAFLFSRVLLVAEAWTIRHS